MRSLSPIEVPDEAYSATGWDGSTQVPTKNAVRDKLAAGWVEIFDQTVTADTDVDVTGYTDILIIGLNLTTSASGVRQIALSVDGGATFYTTTGDYALFSDNGALTNTTGIIGHGTASSAARTIAGDILGINMSGIPKLSREIGAGRQRLFLASEDPITDIRLFSSAGTISGGRLIVLGR